MSDVNSMMFTVDDPGLTAFALGELEGPESERYAAAVAQSVELQEFVRQIQFEAQLLTTELQREPAVPMTESHKAAIFNQLRDSSSLTRSAELMSTQSASTESASTESASTESTRYLVSHQTGGLASRKPGVGQARQKRWVSWLAVASSTVAAAAAVAVCLPRPRPSETAVVGKSTVHADLANAALPVATPATDSVDGLSFSPSSPAMPGASTSAPKGARSLKSANDLRELADTSHVVSEPVQASVSTLEFSPADESGPAGNSENSKLSSDSVRSRSGQGSGSEQMGEGEHLEGAKGISVAGRTSSVRRALTPQSEVNPTQLGTNPAGAPSQESDQLSVLKTAHPFAKEATTKPGSNPESMGQSKDGAGSADRAESVSQGRFDVSKRPSAGKSGQVANLESREKQKDGYHLGDDAQYISAGSSEGKSGVTLEQLEASRPGQGQPQGGPGKPGVKGAAAFGRQNSPQGNQPGVLDAFNQTDAKKSAASAPESNTPFGTTVDSLADRPTAKPDAAAAGIESKFSRGTDKANWSFSKGEAKGDEVTKSELPPDGAKRAKQFALAELSKLKEAEGRESRGISVKELQDLERSTKELGRNQLVPHDPVGAETYQPIFENSFIPAVKERVSTFSIDVDSAAYSNARRFLESGQVPHPDAVRIEELVNYFAYQYPVPQDGKPFSVNTDIAGCPWSPGHHLVRIGLKGREIPKGERPPSSLVFLVDVSGSMSPENKLPLVRSSLKTLVSQLDERDRIAIVTYAGEAGVKLPATSVAQKDVILAAIDSLGAGGSTNGAAGINTAYDIAAKEFIEKGTNRVILCTDGDFNVGVTSDDALVQMIQTRAKGGVFLSIFGFGMGNLKDAKLEQLADKGNGQYGYIDDRLEADKVFVQELSGTLVTIAKDVKIQIDFNPESVGAYRLIGYENRTLAAEDFNNDKKDAGEIGAGHTVTALYEIVPTKDLKADEKTQWMTVKLRYKQPEATSSELIENPLLGMPGQLKLAHTDFQFAAAVASFGMLLRNSQHAGQANWSMVKELAQSGLSHDPYGHRSGFLGLVSRAESLLGERRPAAPPEPDSTVNGKYKSLLRRLNVPQDEQKVGRFRDYGFDQTKVYGGAENLPEGYWVYAAPYWYIWGETTQATPK